MPICSKIFEKVIFNSFFKYLDDNNLLNSNQSGFWPGNSCVHQLLSITHGIYKAFDANPSLDVRGVFLGLSKAFDRVWHDGLMYKLKILGICGNCYELIHSFLGNRHQRMVLNGKSSKLSLIKARVPQGSILAPLLFLAYARILESLAGCRTMIIFAVFCKIGALERNTYWFHVKIIFIVIFGQSFKSDVRA